MKRNIVIATVTAAALVAGGTASAVAFTGDDGAQRQTAKTVGTHKSTGTHETTGADKTHGTVSADGPITVGKAIAAASKAAPGTVTGAELDEDDGKLVWEVDVLGKDGKWHDVDVDAHSTAVLHQHTENDEDGDARYIRDALRNATTDASAAAQAALKHTPGTVTSVDLDDDGSKGAWEVEVHAKNGKQQDLNVDPRSGKVTPDTHSDDHADDDHDDSDQADNDLDD